MFETHNEAQLDGLARIGQGTAAYLHARTVLAIDPTPDMRARFDARAHTGLIRLYNNRYHSKLLVVEHPATDRFEFEQCIRGCGYGRWKIEYTD